MCDLLTKHLKYASKSLDLDIASLKRGDLLLTEEDIAKLQQLEEDIRNLKKQIIYKAAVVDRIKYRIIAEAFSITEGRVSQIVKELSPEESFY